jgi:hypothetical protein
MSQTSIAESEKIPPADEELQHWHTMTQNGSKMGLILDSVS